MSSEMAVMVQYEFMCSLLAAYPLGGVTVSLLELGEKTFTEVKADHSLTLLCSEVAKLCGPPS